MIDLWLHQFSDVYVLQMIKNNNTSKHRTVPDYKDIVLLIKDDVLLNDMFWTFAMVFDLILVAPDCDSLQMLCSSTIAFPSTKAMLRHPRLWIWRAMLDGHKIITSRLASCQTLQGIWKCLGDIMHICITFPQKFIFSGILCHSNTMCKVTSYEIIICNLLLPEKSSMHCNDWKYNITGWRK